MIERSMVSETEFTHRSWAGNILLLERKLVKEVENFSIFLKNILSTANV